MRAPLAGAPSLHAALRHCLRRSLVAAALLCSAAAGAQGAWAKLAADGIRDPRSPAIKLLQEPAEALTPLAREAPDPNIGNQVRWVQAIEKGLINPRSNILPETKMEVLDLDIYLNIGGSTNVVRFPHKAHTYWLDCKNCHDRLFSRVAGETPISMLKILEGEQCGQCHGAVAFPLTECARCHAVPQMEFVAYEQAKRLKRVPGGKVAR
jgi:c(7)-type cytochrome triheme protein